MSEVDDDSTSDDVDNVLDEYIKGDDVDESIEDDDVDESTEDDDVDVDDSIEDDDVEDFLEDNDDSDVDLASEKRNTSESRESSCP